jgi:hypothetical protein
LLLSPGPSARLWWSFINHGDVVAVHSDETEESFEQLPAFTVSKNCTYQFEVNIMSLQFVFFVRTSQEGLSRAL